MRVVLTCNYTPWSAYSGGGQHSTHQLATALTARGHDVTVVWTRARGEVLRAHAPPTYSVSFAPFVGLSATRQAPLRPLNALTVAGTVASLCRPGDGLDVIHANGEEGALLSPIARATGAALVVTPRYPRYPDALRGRLAPTSPARLWTWLADPKYPLLGLALRAADRVCPTSEHAARLVQRAFDLAPERLVVVPNGVDQVFGTRRWAPPSDAPILSFGRLDPDKGMDVLIAALAQLGSTRPLRVIGRGDERERLDAQARALGVRVHFEDWCARPALADAIAAAALVVLPSRHESFGNAMAETLAVGAPLVTTTAGSIPEVVPAGAGLLVPPGDVAALARAIALLEGSPARAEALSQAARASGRALGWDAVAARFEAVYASARDGRR